MRNYYFTNRFYYILFGIVALFAITFMSASVVWVGKFLLVVFLGVVLVDVIILSVPKKAFKVDREIPDKFSNGDVNEVKLSIKSRYNFKVFLEILEDLPFQFQLHDFKETVWFDKQEKKEMVYKMFPKTRGEYVFGNIYLIAQSFIGLVKKRHVIEKEQIVACYPSFMQLRKFEFLAINNHLTMQGIKKVRQLEQNTDFAEIREYSPGDEYKHINWKASARKGGYMVNQYQAERSQNIYSIIDKGRAMKMPFNGLTLLDYAINSSLVMSSIAMRKDDKPGLLSFARVPDSFVKASSKRTNMQLISKELYKASTNFMESDYGKLYKFINANIKARSLFLLYTNFETFNAFERQLKYLRVIAKKHLLVVIFFDNSELTKQLATSPQTTLEHYKHTVIEELIRDKKNIVKELRKYGIHSMISKPENLTVDSINTYLGLRSRGAI